MSVLDFLCPVTLIAIFLVICCVRGQGAVRYCLFWQCSLCLCVGIVLLSIVWPCERERWAVGGRVSGLTGRHCRLCSRAAWPGGRGSLLFRSWTGHVCATPEVVHVAVRECRERNTWPGHCAWAVGGSRAGYRCNWYVCGYFTHCVV